VRPGLSAGRPIRVESDFNRHTSVNVARSALSTEIHPQRSNGQAGMPMPLVDSEKATDSLLISPLTHLAALHSDSSAATAESARGTFDESPALASAD
jgi:hypothetical protein